MSPPTRIARLLRLGAIPAAFIVLLLAPGLLGLRSMASTDQLYLQEPWVNQAGAPTDVSGSLTWDTYDFFQPRWMEMSAQLRDGELPMVGDAYPGTEPLASLPITGTLDPLWLPWMVLPAWMAPAFVKALQLAVAIGFTAGWCRRLGLSRRAALVGGLAYASSGFITYWTGWPQSNTAAVVPVVFFAVEGVLRASTARRVAVLAVAFGWLLATGFPAVALYTVMAAVPYTLVRLRQLSVESATGPSPSATRGWLRPLAAVAAGGVLGVVLIAAQLVPLRDLVKWNLAARDGELSITAPLKSLLYTVFPHLEGVPNWHEGRESKPTTGQFFVGLTALLLVAYACTRRRPRLPPAVFSYMVATVVAIIAIVFVGGPFEAVANLVPFVRQNPVNRMMSIASLLLAVLAAAGAEAWWLRDAPRRALPRSTLVAVAGSAAGVVLAIGLLVGVRRAATIPWSVVLTFVALAAVIAGAAFLIRRARGGHDWVTRLGVPVLVGIEGMLFVLPNLTFIDRADFFPTSTSISAAAALQRSDRVDAERTMHPGVGAAYGLRSAAGHSFITREWYDLLKEVQPTSTLSLTFNRFAFTADEADSPVLDRLSVRYLMRPSGYLPGESEAVASSASVGERSVTFDLSTVGAFRGFLVALPGVIPTGSSMEVFVEGAATMRRSLAGDAGKSAFAATVAGEDRAVGERTDIEVVVLLPAAVPADWAFDGAEVAVVRPVADGQRLVHTSDGAIWERLSALPRYRWASSAVVRASRDGRLSWLSASPPADTVLLDAPATTAPTGTGRVVAVDERHPERRVIGTASDGPGILVIADAYRSGWKAFVDDVEVPLVRADHALIGVEVPAGEHVVVLRYDPPGWPLAVSASLAAMVIVIVLVAWPWMCPRARRLYNRAFPPDHGALAE